MRNAKQILDEFRNKDLDFLSDNVLLSIIERTQAEARAEIKGFIDQSVAVANSHHKTLMKMEELKKEREQWGNEFNAVVILKEQLEKANVLLDSAANYLEGHVHRTMNGGVCLVCEAEKKIRAARGEK